VISLHDNSNLKTLKKNLKKFQLMQFRFNNRGPELSGYTEILNEHVFQLNQKTREKRKEIDELKSQIIEREREREYKKEINQLRENIHQINIIGRRNKSVNFDDEKNNRYNNKDYSYNENRSRSHKRETNYRGQQREYIDKSLYQEKLNCRSRKSSRNRQYSRDRSLSRERQYFTKIDNETDKNKNYQRQLGYKYDSNNYEY
jgi:hypothetical protein